MTSEKKLELALEALKVYADRENWDYSNDSLKIGQVLFLYWGTPSVLDGWEPAQNALEEIAGIKRAN